MPDAIPSGPFLSLPIYTFSSRKQEYTTVYLIIQDLQCHSSSLHLRALPSAPYLSPGGSHILECMMSFTIPTTRPILLFHGNVPFEPRFSQATTVPAKRLRVID
jgi:hypothetical protein